MCSEFNVKFAVLQVNIFTFVLAMHASCREKIREPEKLGDLR